MRFASARCFRYLCFILDVCDEGAECWWEGVGTCAVEVDGCGWVLTSVTEVGSCIEVWALSTENCV